MKKLIVGFLTVALFAPVAVSAFDGNISCGLECMTNEQKIESLRAQVVQLTQLLGQMLAQKYPSAQQSVAWGGVTMSYPKSWTLLVNRPESNNDYSASLKESNGSTVALLNKFFGGGDVGYTLIASEQMTSGNGIAVQKAIYRCEGSICADGTIGLVLYRVAGTSGESVWIQVPVNATSYYRNLEAAKNALDEWVKTLKYAATTTTSTSCFVPTGDLYLGKVDVDSNGDVRKLQLWLKSEGYFPDATGTGYYGEKTAEAVVKWQKAHGMDFVTTKSGVGKMTRAKMQEKCKGSVATLIGSPYGGSYDLKAEVKYEGGAVPVATVGFHGKFDTGAFGMNEPKAYIDFGNGASVTALKTVCPGDDCYFQARHLYSKAGTYTITLHTINDAKRIDLATTNLVVTQAACPDGVTPYIAAISPTSGPRGTSAEIWGCGLSGFEGDTIFSFEHSSGQKILLGDSMASYTMSGATSAKIKVQEPCTKGGEYYPVGDASGIPRQCPYDAMLPGTYSVSANPWNKKSNAVNFTVTAQ